MNEGRHIYICAWENTRQRTLGDLCTPSPFPGGGSLAPPSLLKQGAEEHQGAPQQEGAADSQSGRLLCGKALVSIAALLPPALEEKWVVISGYLPLHFASPLQEPTRAKQFLPFLQRAGRTMALVEVGRLHYQCLAILYAYTVYCNLHDHVWAWQTHPFSTSVCGIWIQNETLPCQGHLHHHLPVGRYGHETHCLSCGYVWRITRGVLEMTDISLALPPLLQALTAPGLRE